MNNLPSMLTAIQVNIEQLLLDANNPRFSELGEDLNQVPEGRFADDKVQSFTFDRMKAEVFDVAELKDTIKTLGFLPMDRMVVRRWLGNPTSTDVKYVVIEGNRRLTALKWLISLHEVGKESFSEPQMANFKSLECLLLDEKTAPAAANLILPGLRHVSGIKEWGPYQKAKAVSALRKSGMSSQEAAQSLGLSTRSANSSYKCFLALEQMKNDEEYGEHASPRMYNYFEEIFKRGEMRNWLAWADDAEGFTNEDRRHELYSWMIPGENGSGPKLPESKSIRELSSILADESAMNILRGPEGTLSRALARFEVDHPEDWYPKVTAAAAAVQSLTPDKLRALDEATLKSLGELQARIVQAIKDRESLMASVTS